MSFDQGFKNVIVIKDSQSFRSGRRPTDIPYLKSVHQLFNDRLWRVLSEGGYGMQRYILVLIVNEWQKGCVPNGIKLSPILSLSMSCVPLGVIT